MSHRSLASALRAAPTSRARGILFRPRRSLRFSSSLSSSSSWARVSLSCHKGDMLHRLCFADYRTLNQSSLSTAEVPGLLDDDCRTYGQEPVGARESSAAADVRDGWNGRHDGGHLGLQDVLSSAELEESHPHCHRFSECARCHPAICRDFWCGAEPVLLPWGRRRQLHSECHVAVGLEPDDHRARRAGSGGPLLRSHWHIPTIGLAFCHGDQQPGLWALQPEALKLGELHLGHSPVSIHRGVVLRADLQHLFPCLGVASDDPMAKGGGPEAEEGVELQLRHGGFCSSDPGHVLDLRSLRLAADEPARDSLPPMGGWAGLRDAGLSGEPNYLSSTRVFLCFPQSSGGSLDVLIPGSLGEARIPIPSVHYQDLTGAMHEI